MLSRLKLLVRRFARDRRASIAPMFAVSLIPMVGLVGAAVDYSRASSARTAMQSALDATALAMSNDAKNLSATDLQTKAQAYFDALYSRSDTGPVTVTATYTTTGGLQLVISGSTSMKTKLVSLIGFSSIPITSSSTVAWGMSRLRVALVLDTTGSMSDAGKIGALKTATKNLLTQLQSAAGSSADVYVSIIPFGKDVNVGSSNYTASWVSFDDGTDSSWDGQNGTCSKSGSSTRSACLGTGTCSISGYNSQSQCTSHGQCSISGYSSQSQCTSHGQCSISQYTSQSQCTSHSVCSKSQYTSQNQCTSHSGTWSAGVWSPGTWSAGTWTQATWTPDSHSTWNGCVTDRGNSTGPATQNYDQNVTAPVSGNTASMFPAEEYSYCPSTMIGLSNNFTALNSAVDALTPNGSTNQPIGLVWGWQSLVGGGPLTAPTMDSDYTYNQVIILLTDGLNTQDRWYGNGSSTSTQVDGRMLNPSSSSSGVGTCTNIKNAGITIYTVQVNTSGDPTSTLLRNCASSTDKFYTVTSSGSIGTVFTQIGTQLSKLRVSR